MIEEKFTSFVNISLKIILLLITISSTAFVVGVFPFSLSTLSVSNVLLMFIISSILVGIVMLTFKVIKNKRILDKDEKKVLIIIIILAFLLRAFWIITLDTKPISDFELMFEFGKLFSQGDYDMFKGNNYIARFPHLTFYVIYLGLINSITSSPLFIIKLINLILSAINVFIIYLLCKELFNSKKKGLIGGGIAAIFPPFIIYSSVACTENVAITFFLGSLYLFLLVVKKKIDYGWIILSGLILAVGNLFRSVAVVMLLAYIIYLIIYCFKDKLLKRCILLIISFIIPMLLVSNLLLKLNITEHTLWKGSEPSITSVLKGTNIENNGMWNEEDAKLVEQYDFDYDKIEKASKDIIKERLFSTSPLALIGFYIKKIVIQWSTGDFAGIGWATSEVGSKNIIYYLTQNSSVYIQIIYATMLLFTYLGLYNKKSFKENKEINIIYIIFCGYGLLYIITEMQPRYAYIVSWIFIILPLVCDEEVLNKVILGLKNRLKK